MERDWTRVMRGRGGGDDKEEIGNRGEGQNLDGEAKEEGMNLKKGIKRTEGVKKEIEEGKNEADKGAEKRRDDNAEMKENKEFDKKTVKRKSREEEEET